MNREVNWPEIHRRLERVQQVLEEAGRPTGEKARGILRQRARALAVREKEERRNEATLEIVEFQLATERYGVETFSVQEVHPLRELTPLPGAPPFVSGIINLRGIIVSVLDVRQLFELPASGLTELNKVIVLQSATMQFGILADAIIGVRTIPAASLQASLPTLTGIREEYLKGIAPGRLIILDAERLLGDTNIIVRQEIERV